jgi:hypothetical protein
MLERMLRLGTAASVAGIAVFGCTNAALADNSTLLAAYQGDWRGSGEARPNPQSEPTRISCKISAVFDSAQVALVNKGRCGSTQGTRNLNGTLKASGEALTGEFLSNAAAQGVVNQRLRVVDDMIVSEAEMEDSGKMLKLRTFLTPPKDGAFMVQSQFYDRAKQSWVVASEIEFRKE